MKKFKFLLFSFLIAFSVMAQAITKIDEATTNNPSKTYMDFLKGVDFKNKDGIYLPAGTTAQRPTPTKNGIIRFNTDLGKLEVYTDGTWGSVGGGLEKWATAKPYLVDDVVFQGDNIYKCLVAHTSTSFPTDLSNGYWQELSQTDLSNYVDKTTNQTIAGEKTFSDKLTVNDVTEFNGNSNVNGNIEVSGTAKIGSLTGVLKGSSGNVTTGQVNLASEVTGQLPIANGNNFVNTSNDQVIGGKKTFTDEMRVNNYTKIDNYLDVTDDLLVQGDTNTVGETATGTLKVGTLTGVMKSASGVVTADKVDLGTEVKSVLPYNNNGNSNLLKNATFGNTITDEFWTCTSVNPVGQSPNGQADPNALSAHITLGTSIAGCLQNVTLPAGLVGKNLQFSVFLNADQPSEMCVTQDGGVVRCQDYLVADGTKKMILTYIPTSTNVGIVFRSKNNLSGNMYASKAYLGEPQSDEAIIAKFDNTSKKYPCTFNSLSWTGFGTVTTNNLSCIRDGSYLVLEGNFVATGATGSIVEMPLPTNFGSISVGITTSSNLLVGSYLKGVTSTEHGGGVAINSTLSATNVYFTDGATFSNVSINATDRATGTRVGGSISLVNVRIPIREWSDQQNGAIIVCNQGGSICSSKVVLKYIAGASTATDQYGQSYPVTRSGGGNSDKAFNISSLGLLATPICSPTVAGSGAGFITEQTQSNTSVTFRTLNTATTGTDLGITLTCEKYVTDTSNYNNTVTPMSNMNDVRSTDWIVGNDEIDNKPTYRRCAKIVSDIGTTAGTTILTAQANILPLGPHWYYNSSVALYYNVLERTPTNTAVLRLNPLTGIVTYVSDAASFLLKAGQKICLDYEKI